MGQCICHHPAPQAPIQRTREEHIQPFVQVDLELMCAIIPLQNNTVATVQANTWITFAEVEVKASVPEDAMDDRKDEGYSSLERPIRSILKRDSKPKHVRRQRVTFASEVQVEVFQREDREDCKRVKRPTERPTVLNFKWNDVLAEVYGPPLIMPPRDTI